MNEGRDFMFNEAVIGPQRPSVNVVSLQSSSNDASQDANVDLPSQQASQVQDTEIKDEPMEVQEGGKSASPNAERGIPETTQTPNQIDIRSLDMEMRALEAVWTQSCRELNDWTTLTRYANCNDVANMELLADAAWHQSEWGLARDLVVQMEASGSRSLQFSASLLQAKAQIAGGEFVQRMKVSILLAQKLGLSRLEFNPLKTTCVKRRFLLVKYVITVLVGLIYFTLTIKGSVSYP